MSHRGQRLAAAAGPVAAALVGGLATDPDSRWFRELRKPSWYPPPQTFGIVWTGLYAGIAWAAGEGLARGGRRARRGPGGAAGRSLAPTPSTSPSTPPGRRCSSGPTGRGWPRPRA